MNREQFALLLTGEATALLERVEASLAGQSANQAKADLLRLVNQLRGQGHSPELVAAVVSQAQLRRRAVAKFGEFASRMLFTEAGLEQASRLGVAALHAGRFRAAGCRHVADLGCGLGATSLAMASLEIDVTAFEIDEVTAAAATYNLAPFAGARVELADATAADLTPYDGLFFDPARREAGTSARNRGSRRFDPADFSPNFDWVLAQAATRAAGVKLGPGHPHEAIPVRDSAGRPIEAQWVSVAGDLLELDLWFGPLARAGVSRSALLIDAAGRAHELQSPDSNQTDAPVAALGSYIHEPDNAVVRSHLIGHLAAGLGLRAIAPKIAYLSSAEPVDSPWLRSYRLLDSLPFDRKQLRAYFRDRGIGVLEIKKRGADVLPEVLRKELQLKGKGAATLIITRVGDAHRALICEPLSPASVAAPQKE